MGDEQLLPLNVGKIIEDSEKLIVAQLEKEWARTKTPYGLDNALQSTRGMIGEAKIPRRLETQQIFLGAGFQAWLAYFLATGNQGRHYSGQSLDNQTFDTFDCLSRADRAVVAKTVALIECHPTVDKAITALMANRKRQSKLR